MADAVIGTGPPGSRGTTSFVAEGVGGGDPRREAGREARRADDHEHVAIGTSASHHHEAITRSSLVPPVIAKTVAKRPMPAGIDSSAASSATAVWALTRLEAICLYADPTHDPRMK
jgi:hypothetical protein